MAGIAESLISQIQQAGQPRIAKSTTTFTGEEDPNIGMLGMILAMLLGEEKAKDIPPFIPPESLAPVGGLMPTTTTTPIQTALPTSGLDIQGLLERIFGSVPPQSDIPGAPWRR